MAEDGVRHMDREEFLAAARRALEWVADYREGVERHPVLSRAEPGALRRALPAEAPERGEGFEEILADVERLILPGITHWQSPGFFAYFPSNASEASLIGELLSAGLGVQGMLWATSPACTELESHVLDWLVGLLGLPPGFRSDSAGGGVIQDSASSAALCALVAARERATAGEANRRGCDGRLVAYASTQAHSSIEKAVRIAGLGSDNLRRIDVDEGYAMRPETLAAVLAADREAGRVPAFVCATLGTTSSGAFDPLSEVARLCREHGAWLHVDAAWAGAAAICPELRGPFAGLEGADSYCFNPHKWLLTHFDCTAFWVADRRALTAALSISPEYLRNRASDSGAVTDYRDWQVPLGRRFRALKLWLVLRYYGAEGLRAMIRSHVALAAELAGRVRDDERFELAAPPSLGLVCFRLRAGDAENQSLMERFNAEGSGYLTHSRLGERLTLRLSVGQYRTGRRHVRAAWDRLRALVGESGSG